MIDPTKTRFAALAVATMVAAACGDTTGPELELRIDTQEALADYEALDAVLASPELRDFRASAIGAPFGRAPGAGLVAALAEAREPGGPPSAVAALLRAAAARSLTDGPLTASVISETHRGATFVYDPVLAEYLIDPSRSGAPETGVRFVWYEADEHGAPLADREIGHVDLIDEGDDAAEDVVLRLVVVRGDLTVLEYGTTLDHDEGRTSLAVAGFLTGDDVRLDFDIAVEAAADHGPNHIDVSFELRVDGRDFSIAGAVTGIEEEDDGEGHIDVTVRHRQASIRADVTGTGGVLDGTIYMHGEPFATVSGPEDDPTILSADGDPLIPAEAHVLHRILEVLDDVFELLEDLLEPVEEIVILGVIL